MFDVLGDINDWRNPLRYIDPTGHSIYIPIDIPEERGPVEDSVAPPDDESYTGWRDRESRDGLRDPVQDVFAGEGTVSDRSRTIPEAGAYRQNMLYDLDHNSIRTFDNLNDKSSDITIFDLLAKILQTAEPYEVAGGLFVVATAHLLAAFEVPIVAPLYIPISVSLYVLSLDILLGQITDKVDIIPGWEPFGDHKKISRE